MCFVLSGSVGCMSRSAKSKVIVMGMIHRNHNSSSTYGIKQVKAIVRRVNPDFILCEIPPDRIEAALAEYGATGQITEPRVRMFPEYVDAIIPLMSEMYFELVPCAAWTKEMAKLRSDKLKVYEGLRSKDYIEFKQAQEKATLRIREEGMFDDPKKIHTRLYDEIIERGMEPYDRLFNDDLGIGGWENINAAHYALIEKALDQHTGQGKRFLITFGAYHKYWFLEKLRRRHDVVLTNANKYIP